MTHKNAPKNFQLPKTFLNIEQKVGKIRKVLHFENEIEHKILVTYVIAKVSFRHSRHFSSFPRKRESRISDFQIIFEYC
ncbi:hypothetical protein, partial [Neisseria meningitidis]|uniref:hypothetical protein n=1 Tax=Neisseria meningitidis TaxID=487 RepID=UPI001E525EA4